MTRPTHCRGCPAPLPDNKGPGRPRIWCDACNLKRKRTRWREWSKERYAKDPEYRERRLAGKRKGTTRPSPAQAC